MPKYVDGMSECDRELSQDDSKPQVEQHNCDYTFNGPPPKHKTLKKPRCEHRFCKIDRLKNQYKEKASRDALTINRDVHTIDTDLLTINSMCLNVDSEGTEHYQRCYQTKMEHTAVDYEQHQRFRIEQLHRRKKEHQYNQLMVESYLRSLSTENRLQTGGDYED